MNTEEELLSIGRAWDEAMVSNQVDEIEKFMSDDWVIVGTEGGITSKKSFLENIHSGILTHSRMDSEESHIKVYGDAAIVISRGTSAGKYSGQPFHFYEWSTSVFTRN